MVEKTFDIELELPGLVIASGYIMDQEYLYPNQVVIKGPEDRGEIHNLL
jgi:hypothetical protein